ncbi:glycosyltransferase [Mammaliicoccus sciuri]|uniref:glycosyltransferase n=1 Tax=Mammaliicoccus sciuri TaxID=1296 RepID=UPI0014332927|nr:glycosyltransferase [Mammaliicoccus sciuri]NKD46798.1 glycosyltransferase [Mammaliicoccus sciuri]
MNIKYIGFYDIENSKSDRVSNIAAIKKMDYITNSLIKLGYNVEIISPSWMGINSKVKFEKKQVLKRKENLMITRCLSWYTKSKITEKIKIFYSLVWLFLYLLINTKKGENILVYHAEWLSYPIIMAKFIKRFELILEVEEIYSKVWKKSKSLEKMENRLLKSGDKYLFVSDELRKLFDIEDEKCTVLYGAYNVVEIEERKKFDKEYIDLIYAGSIDEVKGGAFKSLDIILELPSNYKLHILGSGKEKSIKALNNRIKEINKIKNENVCYYSGVLHGKNFNNYLMKCDIALNPQHIGDYMGTAFPSKIISYLSHNLHVVTTPIKSIKTSIIKDYIVFANDDQTQSFIEAIESVNLADENFTTNIVKNLDEKFMAELNELIKYKIK